MTYEAPIFELHVNPTYAVCIPQIPRGGRRKTIAQLANEENLKRAKHTGELSKKAIRRLSNAVNWLVASAAEKWVYDETTNKRYKFKLNFITLTLPTLDHNISDHAFKKVLLHNFINTCRYRFGLRNFVWKVEAQQNGNIHAHFTTDTFIHWRALRDVWNRILIKQGVMDAYTEKHIDLSFDEYCALYNSKGNKSIEQMKKAYVHGQETGWKDPNSTDVHSVYKVKDIGAYMAKYMAKNEEGKRKIKGRLWGCSTNLSESNKLVIELLGSEGEEIMKPLMSKEIEYKEIFTKSSISSAMKKVGEIFFLHLRDWGTTIKGRLLELFNIHRFNIRHNINIEAVKTFVVENFLPPEPVEIFEDFSIEGTQIECPF